MQPAKYTLPAIALHWLIAALVFALFAIGWHMVDLPQSPSRSQFFALHKSIGITVFVLLWVRLVWRLRHRPPELPETIPRWQRMLAQTVHRFFYLMLLIQPLSGYLSSSFSGYRTRWFGLPLPHWGWRDAPLNELFTEIHVIGSIVFLALIIVHLVGALSHVLSGEISLLRRIWPW